MKRAVVVLLLLIANAIVSDSKHRASSAAPLSREAPRFAGSIAQHASTRDAIPLNLESGFEPKN